MIISPRLSVIICTHNPREDYLFRVVEALKKQTLSLSQWELIIIDNASSIPVSDNFTSWHPHGCVVPEMRLGLTMARKRGFQVATAPILVYVDDDNVLAPNYLDQVLITFQQHPTLGVVAGRSLPEFEVVPPNWIKDFYTILALRDFGTTTHITPGKQNASCQEYPRHAPAGAGMALRKRAFDTYWSSVHQDPTRLTLGRTGRNLVSGEDNDIVLTLLNHGWDVGYVPQLQLTHLISATRLSCTYLARLNFATCQSWVQVLDVHGIRLWPAIPHWSLGLRQAKAWLKLRPWRGPSAYVRWRGACGLLSAQAKLSHLSP